MEAFSIVLVVFRSSRKSPSLRVDSYPSSHSAPVPRVRLRKSSATDNRQTWTKTMHVGGDRKCFISKMECRPRDARLTRAARAAGARLRHNDIVIFSFAALLGHWIVVVLSILCSYIIVVVVSSSSRRFRRVHAHNGRRK